MSQVAKLFWKIVAVVLAFAIVMVIIGLAAGWFNRGVEIVSPENVEKQYQVIIDDWNALYAAAENACAVGNPTPSPNDPVIVENPATAYGATYRNIVAQYNSHQQDIFRAKLAGPPGYPTEIPIFTESKEPNPDWCSVSNQLDQLKAES